MLLQLPMPGIMPGMMGMRRVRVRLRSHRKDHPCLRVRRKLVLLPIGQVRKKTRMSRRREVRIGRNGMRRKRKARRRKERKTRRRKERKTRRRMQMRERIILGNVGGLCESCWLRLPLQCLWLSSHLGLHKLELLLQLAHHL